MKTYFFYFLSLVLLITSCDQPAEVIAEVYQPTDAHDAYKHGLESSGLDKTRLGQLWLEASEKALLSPVHISTPYAANIYVSDTEAKSFGYQFKGKQGEKITITLSDETPDDGDVFLDVYRLSTEEGQGMIHLASADTIEQRIEFEPIADLTYILRVQPELLRKGKDRLEIRNTAALAFPVTGKDKSAIGSLFGVPRDAGRRKHHGIDIFSRRHTPIIAPCDGYIRSTEPNKLGGEVIWMKDDKRDQVLYFAHLEDVFVEGGDYVSRGDTIGTVGNSGNAKTTACHLHFGIYSDGPIDPYNHVVTKRTRLKRELADSDLISTAIRTSRPTSMRLFDIKKSTVPLPEDQLCIVRGTTGMYYHVELPDGQNGYLSYLDVEQLTRPLRKRLPAVSDIVDTPTGDHLVIAAASSLEKAKAYGLHEDFIYIKKDESFHWIKS